MDGDQIKLRSIGGVAVGVYRFEMADMRTVEETERGAFEALNVVI